MNSYTKTEFPESHGVNNQSSIDVLVPIVVFMLVILMLVCICKVPKSRQDVANNDLLDNQSRANRPQPTLIDMEPTVPSGRLTVPLRSTNIQVS